MDILDTFITRIKTKQRILNNCLLGFYSRFSKFEIIPQYFSSLYNLYRSKILPELFIDSSEKISLIDISIDRSYIYNFLFISIYSNSNNTCHSTLLVFDIPDNRAAYFDSNGPDSNTTPKSIRNKLMNICDNLNFHTSNFSMSADPQFYTCDGSCASWAMLASLLIIKKQKINLNIWDFKIIDRNLSETLKVFIINTAIYVYDDKNIIKKNQNYYLEIIKTKIKSINIDISYYLDLYKNKIDKIEKIKMVYDFQEFISDFKKNSIKYDNELENIFINNDGNIDECIRIFLFN